MYLFHMPGNKKNINIQKLKSKSNYMLITKLSHIQSKGEAHQISPWKLGNLSWHSR